MLEGTHDVHVSCSSYEGPKTGHHLQADTPRDASPNSASARSPASACIAVSFQCRRSQDVTDRRPSLLLLRTMALTSIVFERRMQIAPLQRAASQDLPRCLAARKTQQLALSRLIW